MAIWTQIYGTDLWSAAVTKINNVIGSYNNWSGGTENQRKVKASATDFDTAWCDPENKINSSTSFNLGTLLVGDSKTIALPYHSYSSQANIGIKAYSVANPTNYIIGNITAIPDNQNITVNILEKGGSGTQTDMVVIPYVLDLDYDQYTLFAAGAYPNGIFVSKGTLANTTFNSHNLSWVRNGNLATVSGTLIFTATSTVINDNIVLTLQTDRWIKNGLSLSIMGTCNITRITGSSIHSSVPGLCGNYSLENAIKIYVLPLGTVIGDSIQLNFSFTYIVA
jgi:hypothetical protein